MVRLIAWLSIYILYRLQIFQQYTVALRIHLGPVADESLPLGTECLGVVNLEVFASISLDGR
jgi:hypothetical protein